MSGSSSATAMTRWRSSAARTSPASGSRTCSRRSSSARASAPTSSSRPATSPTTRRCRLDPARAAIATTATASSGPATSARWTSCSRSTREPLPRVSAWAESEFPLAAGEAPAAHARAIKAKALDLLRGLLPASSLSHMGIFATGQTYEQLILHLLAHPLPEARAYGRDDPRRAQGGDAELRLPGRAAGPGRRVDRLPRDRARARASAGRSGSAWTSTRAAGGTLRHAAARRGRRGRPARGAAVRGQRELRGARSGRRSARSTATTRAAAARRPRRRTARTAATGPAAGSRRCATGSRSSPTTARSATSSATGC